MQLLESKGEVTVKALLVGYDKYANGTVKAKSSAADFLETDFFSALEQAGIFRYEWGTASGAVLKNPSVRTHPLTEEAPNGETIVMTMTPGTPLYGLLQTPYLDLLSDVRAAHTFSDVPKAVPAEAFSKTVLAVDGRRLEAVVRYAINGEVSGIHGLVSAVVTVPRGLDDVYIAVFTPYVQGEFATYPEPMRSGLRMFSMLEVVKADFKAAARRVEELVFLFVASLAAGVVGSYAGRYAVFLVAFLASQLSAYLYVIRDWDRGVLEGLVYYAGHSGVYVSKLVVTSALSMGELGLK